MHPPPWATFHTWEVISWAEEWGCAIYPALVACVRWKVRVSSHGGWDNAAQAGLTALPGPHGGEGARRVGGVRVHDKEGG